MTQKVIAKELRIGDFIYCPSIKEIRIYNIKSISLNSKENNIKITWGDGYYDSATIELESSIFTDTYNKKYFLNLKDAEYYQKTLREKHLEDCQNKLEKAIEELKEATKLLSNSLIKEENN